MREPLVYHGVFGHGLFQSIYPTPRSVIADYVSSVEWFALTGFIFVLAVPFERLRIVPFLMFGATFMVALSYMIHARLEARFDTIPARVLVMILAFTQPLVRGWARYFTLGCGSSARRGRSSWPRTSTKRRPARWLNLTRRRYWNEEGVGREALITGIVAMLAAEGWRYSTDTGWKPWDVQIYGNLWWNLRLRTVTEYHGGPKCLTRIRLTYSPVVTTVLVNAIAAPIIFYRHFFTHADRHHPIALFLYALLLLFIVYRGFRLKLRLADLVESAAHKSGLTRVTGGAKPKARPDENAAAQAEMPSAETVMGVSPPSPVSPPPAPLSPQPAASGVP